MQKALKTLGIMPNSRVTLRALLSENFNGDLYGMTRDQMDKVKALREVIATYEISRQAKPRKINGPSDAATLLSGLLKNMDHEEVWVAFLDADNSVIGKEQVFVGTTTEVTIAPKDIMARSLSQNACGIILYHNHPSGNPVPSTADIKRTEELKKACDALGVSLLDHVIISPSGYYSFSEESVINF